MSMFLLAFGARDLFIVMLVVMLVVSLLLGFVVFIALKPIKKPPEYIDSSNVRGLLARRESQLTVELMSTKADDEKRNALLNNLRRVKSAQQLIDELVAEETALEGETEAEVAKQRANKKPLSNGADVKVKKPQAPASKPVAKPAAPATKPAEKSEATPVAKPAVETKSAASEAAPAKARPAMSEGAPAKARPATKLPKSDDGNASKE